MEAEIIYLGSFTNEETRRCLKFIREFNRDEEKDINLLPGERYTLSFGGRIENRKFKVSYQIGADQRILKATFIKNKDNLNDLVNKLISEVNLMM